MGSRFRHVRHVRSRFLKGGFLGLRQRPNRRTAVRTPGNQAIPDQLLHGQPHGAPVYTQARRQRPFGGKGISCVIDARANAFGEDARHAL